VSNAVLEANMERLWETIDASAEIGRCEGQERGLTRLALSDADRIIRDTFIDWATAAGCQVDVDEVGNIFARRPGRDASLPAVAIGSHLDTTVCGGRYDGILGVLTGLEIVRTLNDNSIETTRPIDVVNWTDEEGTRFSHSMMGSSAFAGLLPVADVLAATDADGLTFGSELTRIGYAGSRPAGNRAFDAYFELHIEQGPALDAGDVDVGIVTGGLTARGRRWVFLGQSAHVGPTPMDRRRNALTGAGYAIGAINDIGWNYHESGGKTTVARIECQPNRYGVIPERAVIAIDFRHPDPVVVATMAEEIDAAVRAAAERANVSCEMLDEWTFGGVTFSEELVNLLTTTADDLKIPFRTMTSEAGHDAYSILTVAPAVMIFTPCKDGISHGHEEEIDRNRTADGVNLLLNAAIRRANRPG
jgi:N-carbamoyl-L-amino-acid hydrolase